MRTAEKGLRVHVEPNKPGSLQPDQDIGLQGHHTLSTSMFGNPSLSKLMHQRRDLELHSCKKDAQSPLLPKLLPPQSNDTPT